MSQKICDRCKTWKIREKDFSPGHTYDGFRHQCKACHNKRAREHYLKNPEKVKQRTYEWRRRNPGKYHEHGRRAVLKYRYKITEVEVQTALMAQKHKCKICQEFFDPEIPENRMKLQVDHCHRTGKFRGMLCHICNKGIGFFKDDPNLFLRAVEYLKSN